MAPRGRSSSAKGRSSPAKASAAPRTTTTASASAAAASSGGKPVLYPTVAVSDLVFAAANFSTVYYMWATAPTAALGFLIVGAAASAGVGRFGFAPHIFTGANEELADTSAFVAYPIVGLLTAVPQAIANPAATIVALVIVHALVRGLVASPAARAKLRVPFNLLCFLGPLAYRAYLRRDAQMAGALAAFIVAAVAIRADRDSLLFGIRRENAFHYVMAAATVLMGQRLIIA